MSMLDQRQDRSGLISHRSGTRSSVAIAHKYQPPARTELTGGDFFAFDRHGGMPLILLGDVSAKGIEGDSASALTAAFHVASLILTRPSYILARLNAVMMDTMAERDSGIFSTAFVCRFLLDLF